ncbi:MAG: mechanosensitive ion channel family protein [Actinomycetota bacterium]|nr:mechanosensitive ion channel family protein [Actinomycetota bacterium]
MTRWRRERDWILGVLSSLLALAALVTGSAFGHVSTPKINPRLIAWISAAVLLVFGGLGTTRLSSVLGRRVASTSLPAAGGAVRITTAAVGYLIVIFGVLAVVNVSIEHLLVGAGLAGVVLGIAAQQSLSNVFAGLVLIFARPFHVGDRVRVRSGSLGGIFDARVVEMSLTYVSLHTEDGVYKIPNSAMLAAGVARTPLTPLPQPPGTAAQKTSVPKAAAPKTAAPKTAASKTAVRQSAPITRGAGARSDAGDQPDDSEDEGPPIGDAPPAAGGTH